MSDSRYLTQLLKRLRSDRGYARATRVKPARPRRKKRFNKSWTFGADEVSNKFMEQSQDVFVGVSDVGDYIRNSVLMDRNDRCIGTEHVEITVLASAKDWNSFIDETKLRVVRMSNMSGIILQDESLSYISYDITSSSTVVKMYGDEDFVVHWLKAVRDKFEEVTNVIEWIYNSDGASIEVPLRGDRTPVDEMYPWLGDESLASYYDRFMASDASILLLIGPPGTGKTTFIRGLLSHTNQSAIVTYDASILSKDFVFAQFIEGERDVFVIEDADNFLGARSSGNDIMHKFLNVGDGLVTTKNKKMIFSTNLPSIKDIDSALIRPGRCFDIVNFAALNGTQAQKLADKLCVELDHKDSGQYSIADIFHKQVLAPKTPRRGMGFV